MLMTELCNQIWKTGKWPKDRTISILILIHKKGSTAKCSNYRTIVLISHASKVLLKIIQLRLKPYLEYQIPQEQAGFVKGKYERTDSKHETANREKTGVPDTDDHVFR